MKKSLFIIPMMSLLFVGFSLASCDEHEHEFATELTHDDNGHWYAATCEHKDEKLGYEEHDLNVTTYPSTCTAKEYTITECSKCDYRKKKTNTDADLDPENHPYEEEFSYDSTHHWHKTTCKHDEIIVDYEPHNFVGDRCEQCNQQESITALEFELVDGEKEYKVVSYNNNIKNVIIPATYNNYPVVAISNNAFENSEVVSIKFEEGSKFNEIGEYAFKNCDSLTTVELVSTIETLGQGIFEDCDSLTSVKFDSDISKDDTKTKSKLTYLSDGMFKDCDSLVKIDMVKTIETIGVGAFENCKSFKEFNFYFETNNRGKKEYDGVKTISDNAFKGCESLETFEFVEIVQTIGASAFENCKALTSIVFDESEVKEIGEAAFKNCDALVEVMLPDSLKEVNSYVFENCDLLANVGISTGVVTVNEYAFKDCKALTTVEFVKEGTKSSKLEVLYPNAFDGCDALVYNIYDNGKYLASGSNENFVFVAPTNTNITNIIFHEKVEVVSVAALQGCNNLTEMTLKFVGQTNSSKESYIGYLFGAPNYMENNNYIPATLTSIRVENNAKIANNAFYNCGNIETVFVGKKVSTIATSAFENCTGLKTITFEESIALSTIDSRAFYNCNNLPNVYLPNSTTTIGDFAFYGCEKIYTFTINEKSKLTSIGYGAFANNYRITEILIPDDVKTIGEMAFYNCTNLAVVNNDSKLELTINSPSYGYVGYYAKVLANGSKKQYETSEKVEVITTPDYFMFTKDSKDNYTLVSYYGEQQSITLPLTIDSASTYSIRFENSTANTVIIPNGKTNLDKLAFANNSTIKFVVLPDSITTIEESAFAKCVSLESVVMNNVSVIKTSAFEYCESLTTLTLPTTLTKVEGYAFYGCEKLNNISYLGTALQWANVEINQTGNQVLNNTVFA